MRLSDFDYSLPRELIAQYPLPRREASRLLVLHRRSGAIEHREFRQIAEYLREGDGLILNQTKVFPARLIGFKDRTGGKVEVLLLRRMGDRRWEVLIKPRRVRMGTRVVFGEGELCCEIAERTESGSSIATFEFDGDFDHLLDRHGTIPLPPYIRREAESIDVSRYQTVYARDRGAVAAPTAGFHFSEELLKELERKGVKIASIILHVGWGTFRPVAVDDPRSHRMEAEYFEVGSEAVRAIDEVKEKGGRIFAVGTTTVRALETAARESGRVRSESGWTELFIYQPYVFQVVDCLITNFHLPRTTLLMLVSAFAGRESVMRAYGEAIKRKYRFYSYGDAMLIQ